MSAVATMPAKKIVMGRAYLPLYHNRDSFVLIESPRGCLKTCSILNILMMYAAQYPGLRWYIWRSTRALLSTTVLPSFEEYVIPAWHDVQGMRLLNPNARPTQRSEYIFENGSVFLPIGLDDVLRGTSSEGAGGYLAEGIELDSRDRAVALVGMMRQPGIPFHKIMVDVNPGPSGHWTNSSAEPIDPSLRRVDTREDYERLQEHNSRPAENPTHKWKRIVAKIQDNPYYFDVVNWKLTEAGASYLKSLGTLTGHLQARWVAGEWRNAEGGVYPQFDEELHVQPAHEIPDYWPILCGYDPGFDHPCAWLWFAIAPNGRLLVIDEIVGSGIDLPTLAQKVKDRNAQMGWIPRKCLGDPQYIFNRKQEAESVQRQMSKRGIFLTGWPRTGGNMDAMVTAVRDRLIAKTIRVFDRCTETIAAFQGWSYRRTSAGEVTDGDSEKYEQKYKDSMDVVRGIVATRPAFKTSGAEVTD